MKDIVQHGTAALEPFKGSTVGHPDPSWVLQLSDETLSNSNLYAVQKMFDGKFQFDVFFESASANQKLSCSSFPFYRCSNSTDGAPQPPHWTKESPLWWPSMTNASLKSSPSLPFPITSRSPHSPKPSPPTSLVVSATSMVNPLLTLGLRTSGTKMTNRPVRRIRKRARARRVRGWWIRRRC